MLCRVLCSVLSPVVWGGHDTHECHNHHKNSVVVQISGHVEGLADCLVRM